MTDLERDIAAAEALLPGEPAAEGEQDPRWQAIIAVAGHKDADPEVLWPFVARWGADECADVRMAIATCLLEHLLEDRTETYAPLALELAEADERFKDTLSSCWFDSSRLSSVDRERYRALVPIHLRRP